MAERFLNFAAGSIISETMCCSIMKLLHRKTVKLQSITDNQEIIHEFEICAKFYDTEWHWKVKKSRYKCHWYACDTTHKTDRCRFCRSVAEITAGVQQCQRRWLGDRVDDRAGPCACVVSSERAAIHASEPMSASQRDGALTIPSLLLSSSSLSSSWELVRRPLQWRWNIKSHITIYSNNYQ